MPLKNILLINPWICDFTAYDFWLRPQGLLQIAAILQRYARCRLSFIDCLDRRHPLLPRTPKSKSDGRGHFTREEVPKPDVLKNVPRKFARYGIPLPLFLRELDAIPTPDLVLMTCVMTYWYPGVQTAVDLVRKKFGGVPIVLGGVYATLLPEHARSSSGADLIVEGQAENKILAHVRAILGDAAADDAMFGSMDECLFPAVDLLRDKTSLALVASRGCPFRCSFCASRAIAPRFEQRSPASVLDEIETCVLRYGARHFAFYDDALLLNKEDHILSVLRGVVERRLPVSFHSPNGLHIREIDAETARLFRRSGFKSIYLSQESTDDAFLKRSCSKVSSGDLERAAALLNREGYDRRHLHVYLIAGVPGQSVEGIRDSIRHVRRLGLKPHVAYFSPVPGTEDWRRLIEMGLLPENADPLLHNKLAFPYLRGDFSPKDFEDLQALLRDSERDPA